jgi:pimeloyl-ACP methyl ester carboxylesterase
MLKKLTAAALISLASMGAYAASPSSSSDPTLYIHGYLGELYPYWEQNTLSYWGNLPLNTKILTGAPYEFFQWSTISQGVNNAQLLKLHKAINALAKKDAWISVDGTEQGATQVDIVAHSFGGLLIRAYIKKYGIGPIHRIVTLGTPHQGTSIASFGAIYNNLCDVLAQGSTADKTCDAATDTTITEAGAQQMIPGSTFLDSISKETKHSTRMLALYNKSDEIVPAYSANGWDAANAYLKASATCNQARWVASYHMGIMDSYYTANQVAQWTQNSTYKAKTLDNVQAACNAATLDGKL